MYGRNDIEAIYQRYLQAFKKGVYNYIKEEPDPVTQEIIPRKYFSGGFNMKLDNAMSINSQENDLPQVVADQAQVTVNLIPQNISLDNAMFVPEFEEMKDFPVGIFREPDSIEKNELAASIERNELADIIIRKLESYKGLYKFHNSEYLFSFNVMLQIILENLYQHEFKKDSDHFLLRVYQSESPVPGVRIEFWGPNDKDPVHSLPKIFTNRIWFSRNVHPWTGNNLPKEAIIGGQKHI